jgi:hypothetical protein
MTNFIFWDGTSRATAPQRVMGTHQIAHWLRKHGYTARVIDFCPWLDPKTIAEITLKWADEDTVAIGVSTTWWTEGKKTREVREKKGRTDSEPSWVIEAREIVESARPDLKWLLGGANATVRSLEYDWFKFHDNAEDDIIKWADARFKKFKLRGLFDIKTLSHRFIEDDCIESHEALPIELGRGCKFKCKFCQYPLIGKKPGTYLRDMQCVKDEILYNYEKFGTTNYFYLDDTVNEDDDKLQAMVDMAQSLPFEISWVGYNRADLIYSKPHTAQWLIDSGMKSCFFGIESLHPEASKLIGKGWSGKHAREWLPKLRHDIWKDKANFTTAFIIGIEPETEEDIYKTADWCIENDIADWTWAPLYIRDVSLVSSILTKGLSEFERNAQQYGYEFKDPIPHRWVSTTWTFTKAEELNAQITKSMRRKKTIAGWALMELASLGYNVKEIMDLSYRDILGFEHDLKTEEFLSNYVRKLLELK